MNKSSKSIISIASLLIIMLAACSIEENLVTAPDGSATSAINTSTNQVSSIAEYDLFEIPLPDELSSASKEYSGLAWYGDSLILLPQYPNGIYGNQDGLLFAIDQEDLNAFILDPTFQIKADSIPFDDAGLSSVLDGFEGFEAIVFIGNSVFLTIETRGGDPMKAFIVRGTVSTDETEIKAIQLDGTSLVELPIQNDNSNASYEALTSDGKFIYTFFEQYGTEQNEQPFVIKFDSNLQILQKISIDAINYRLTDATTIDEEGSFWMINYFFPGDTHLAVEEDPLSSRYELGESHQRNQPVERLVKFRLKEEEIALVEEPPLYLKLLENNEARNWEGLAKSGDSVFFLITDKFPTSILGYVIIK